MQQELIHIALVVNDYDEAITFYTKKLGFELLEDTCLPDENKRWVVIAPPGSKGASILLARANNDEQRQFVGNQSGGRVFLFLHTQNFDKDYTNMISNGIEFVREPSEQDYGTVAVFKDLYGNLWDLLELTPGHSMAARIKAMCE
ncbi:VOC family protein [Pseudoalteromonas sp. JBTF-M23]|uniref:VOC family protein n=1 Tax=Pseudoalteromonas caenipelagi TaxID=2726988 RepID=A0A849VAD1_9GAMM|nr:VOC family protein [Pseudoalteromonas caenipelagi]NOU50332.1 VOC family protein [Pseudoalteromonas caenipelagi]